MIRLSQRDPKWAAKKLGSSNLTLGRYGCTTTSISMLTDYFGKLVSPPTIAGDPSKYTSDGLVLWNKMSFLVMKFVLREKGRKDKNILAAIKDPNMGVLLEVNKGQHWVVAVRQAGESYIVADPWDGKDCDVIKKYFNITGASYFERI